MFLFLDLSTLKLRIIILRPTDLKWFYRLPVKQKIKLPSPYWKIIKFRWSRFWWSRSNTDRPNYGLWHSKSWSPYCKGQCLWFPTWCIETYLMLPNKQVKQNKKQYNIYFLWRVDTPRFCSKSFCSRSPFV